ncbi:MAG: VanZ family protein [Lachnospiraceae bacterium]
MKTNEKNGKFALWGGRVLFGVYLIGLCYFLFFAENYGRAPGRGEYRYNLIPFHEIERFWKYRSILGIHSFYNLVGNVLCFVPAGFFVPILRTRRRRVCYTFCVVFQMSLLIELIQLVTKVGSFDVDDIILNTLGGLLGYCLLMIADRWRGHEKKEIL